MEKINRIKSLVEQLNVYRDDYYNKSRPTVSDAEYDKLFDELDNLEKETGIVMSNSPTQTVGYEVRSELKKVKHEYPMLSLDKTKSVDDLNRFVGDKEAIVMLKLDGLTVAVTYENKKVKHEYPMLSLDKTKSVDDLNRFVGDKEAIVMLKLDGLTVAVTYENRIMVKAETRGNGSEGELITSNAKTFVNLPTTIPYKEKLVVFGEAIIT